MINVKIENINNSQSLLNTDKIGHNEKDIKPETKDIKKETPAAVYEKTPKENKVKGTYDKKEVLKLKMETEKNKERLIKMVQDSLRRQGKTSNIAGGIINPNLLTELDETARAEAKEMISEDGELGVEKVSERLVNFAKAISGGDTSKAGILRDAIEKGFKEAEKMWGGKLPQISKDTYEATMKKFDQWANGTEVEEDKE